VTPFLLVLSAPSGGGKTTITKKLLRARNDLGYSVSATTRGIRKGERDGVDYHFLTLPDFERRQQRGEFLEWATYGGQLYGTLKSEIERIFGQGRHAILDIEVEGARQIRRNFQNSLHLFVLPPSGEVLVERLAGRKTEDPEVVRNRIARAADELAAISEYDYVIVNEDLDVAVSQVSAILEAENRRVSRQVDLPEFVKQLRTEIAVAAEKIGREVKGRGSKVKSRKTTPEPRR
jgi:guanylate kinase